MSESQPVDVVIFGGGVAGLWLLDELARSGRSALLLETVALGNGQTIASQGIIHGGLKYLFDSKLAGPVQAIAQMPVIWRECLSGERQPDLRGTVVRADGQYIWGTGSLKSWFFLKGSTIALRAAPVEIERSEAPPALDMVPGKIMRVPEQVLDTASMAGHLSEPHRNRILHISPEIELTRSNKGIETIRIFPASGDAGPLLLAPRQVVFSAGQGNAGLREKAGLSPSVMQRRPLHMVMVRGPLPTLFGHCVGGPKPRVTITTATDSHGRAVWQIGGQIAEDAVKMDFPELLSHAREELKACVPGISWKGVEFSAYRIDRAEAATSTGQRPEDVHVIQEGNVLTAWPTKLALAPRMAERVLEMLPAISAGVLTGTPSAGGTRAGEDTGATGGFPTPPVASPPWETATHWEPLEQGRMTYRKLGRCFDAVSPIAFGSFKIGRNEKIKYDQPYPLPSEEAASVLLNSVLDAGINLIDSAPAYGLAEERIGRHIGHRRGEFILSTKAGETFENGQSTYDFSRQAIHNSIDRSLRRLRTDAVDLLLIHSDGRDEEVLAGDAAQALAEIKRQGKARFIGFSGKTVRGAELALEWADVLMIEYHPQDRSHEQVIARAGQAQIGILVKKPLGSGKILPETAIPFLLANPSVSSLVIGALSPMHILQNLRIAQSV